MKKFTEVLTSQLFLPPRSNDNAVAVALNSLRYKPLSGIGTVKTRRAASHQAHDLFVPSTYIIKNRMHGDKITFLKSSNNCIYNNALIFLFYLRTISKSINFYSVTNVTIGIINLAILGKGRTIGSLILHLVRYDFNIQ